MFNKKLITILLCILMITSNLAFSQTIVKASGTKVIGWKQIVGTWHYLNSNGVNTIGWVQSGSKWYYLNSNGAMAIGWIEAGGTWYYLNSSGEMITGWIQSGGKWYYLNPSGAMDIGWIQAGGTWYYLNSSGEMAIGWIQTGGNKYYLYSSGKMASNTTIDGSYLGSDGTMQDNKATSVGLNKTTDVLAVGGTDTLIASVLPINAINQAVTWRSSNIATVVVDNTGKITATNSGTATITATTVDGSKTAICAVTVAIVSVEKITALSLDKTTDDLIVGGTDTLTVTVTPNTANEATNWTTSNAGIVTIDNTGKLTAISAGTSIITANAIDGSMRVACIVTVTDPMVKTTILSLNKTLDSLTVGCTETLIASVSPATATNQAVTWTSLNNDIVTVDNTGKMTAVRLGATTIRVVTADGIYSAACDVIVINKQNNDDPSDLDYHSILQKNIYSYLMNDDNRQSVLKRAIELHGGDLSNNCVYFASETIRRAGTINLPEYVCNTLEFTSKLKELNWSTSTDLSKLRPGDICFTKSYGAGPTHTYVFMKWAEPGKYDYAYICDNQGDEYGNVYHIRNINFATETKDPISYFMYKS